MKCQKCHNPATLHITNILGDDQIEELHLCESCAHHHLAEPQSQVGGIQTAQSAASEDLDEPALLNRQCEVCGLKFVDFRNSGRLGCPHDYEEFREELTPLLENIHGETRHCGKTPRRLPRSKQTQSELLNLRKLLLQAVNQEAYEEAARLRDRIRQLEEN